MVFNDKEYYNLLFELININSPTGYLKNMNKFLDEKLSFIFSENIKKDNIFGKLNDGTRYVYLKGENKEKTIAISTHCDKVGLMVKSIQSNGHMILDKIGGIKSESLNFQYAKLITRKNKKVTGMLFVKENVITFIPNIQSENFLEKKEEYDISVGDYVFVNNEICKTEDYILSRYLDNSLSVAMSIHLIDFLISNKKVPACSLLFIFSNKEELGAYTHIPYIVINGEKVNIDISEYIALDVGDVNENVKETDVCLLAKDSYAVYDYESISKIISYAKQYTEISCSIDVCKGGTDSSLLYSVGNTFSKIISFGPPLTNMHGVEKVNKISIENTFNLLTLYIAK